MSFIALEAAAFADVAIPSVVGTNGLAPWNDAAQAPDTGGSVTIEAATLAVDSYPTFTHVGARWTLRGAPGTTRIVAMPVAGPYGPSLLPEGHFVATVDGSPVARATLQSSWCNEAARPIGPDGACPGENDRFAALRRGAYAWWTFPIAFPADGTAELTIGYDQLVDGAWYAYDAAAMSIGIALPRTPRPPGFDEPPDWVIVPAVDVAWRFHGLDPTALAFYPPPAARTAEALTWHASDGSLTSVVALGKALPAPDATTPYAPYLPDDVAEVVRLEDYLARVAFAKEPPTPATWLALVDALRAASMAKDEELSVTAVRALGDLRRIADERMPPADRERTLAWLDQGFEVTETGVLDTPSVGGYLDEADLSGLADAADLAQRRAVTRAGLMLSAPLFVAVGLGLLFLRGRRAT